MLADWLPFFVVGMPVLSVLIQTAGAIILARMAAKIRLLEKNTNSIKDALVKEVGESSEAKGVLKGHANAVAEQAERERAAAPRQEP